MFNRLLMCALIFVSVTLVSMNQVSAQTTQATTKATTQPATEQTEVVTQFLINALIQVESKGNDSAVGDTDMVNKAYGCLQIRQPCVDDYNRWHKTAFQAKDCLENRELSVKICRSYIGHYATDARLGHTPTNEDCARIWNGGPNGYKKKSTVSYWQKVKKILDKYENEAR